MLRRFGAQRRMRQKSQQPEPIIDRDDDNAPLRKLRAVVHRFRTAAPDQRAAVDPDHDRQLARIDGRPDVERQAILARRSHAAGIDARRRRWRLRARMAERACITPAFPPGPRTGPAPPPVPPRRSPSALPLIAPTPPPRPATPPNT